MADELAPPVRLNLGRVVRHVVGVGVGVAVLLLLFGRRGDLAAAAHQMIGAEPGWVAAAIAAEALALWVFACIQHRVLRLAGTTIGLGGLFLLSLANDAISLSVPGEPAVSSAYRYRYYRRRGVTGAGAGWTIFTILIAQAIGMSLVLLLGVVIALTGSTSAGNAGAAAVGLVIVIASFAILIRRDLVLRLAGVLVRATRRAARCLRGTAGPATGGIGARVESTLARMREIPLSPASTVGIVALATAVWACDFLCLLCSFGAVHAAIPWSGVLLAYGVAQVVGSFPIIPGGIGVVEGSLAVILVAYGASRVQALSAALVFRIVTFWLAIAIGWISFGAIARVARRGWEPNR